MGFEPTRPEAGLLVFKTSAIVRSAIPPGLAARNPSNAAKIQGKPIMQGIAEMATRLGRSLVQNTVESSIGPQDIGNNDTAIGLLVVLN